MAKKRKQIKSTESEKPRRESRLRVGCSTISFLLMLALGAFVFFAPTIISRTALLQKVVPLAIPDFEGEVAIGSASLGWFSPVVLNDVSALDVSGNPLADVKQITSEKTLFGLASDQSNLGQFRINHLQLYVEFSDKSSNLEDAIAPILKSSGSDSPTPKFSLVLAEGSASLRDSATGQSWNAEQINATLQIPAAGAWLTAKAAAQFKSADGKTGKLEADVQCQSTQPSQSSPDSGDIAIKCESLPLGLSEPFLRRVVSNARASGTLNSEFTYRFEEGGESNSVEVNSLTLSDLVLNAPEMVGSDTLQLPLLSAKGKVTYDRQQISAENLAINSDLAKVEANGTLGAEQLGSNLLASVFQSQDYRVSGEVDLAALAKMFPQTLRVREQSEITSGKIAATIYSRIENENRSWVGVVETANLTAINNGRPIRWEQPIQVTAFLSNSARGPEIEHLECKSSFLNLKGEGTLAKGSITAEGHLERLEAELRKFVELNDFKLAGELSGKLNWEKANGGVINVGGLASVQNFQSVFPGSRPWQEQKLDIELNAAAIADTKGIQRVDSGHVNVKSNGDLLHVELTQPVAEVTTKSAFPVNVQLNGELVRWLPRIQIWAPFTGWQLEGAIDLTVNGTVSSKKVAVDTGKLKLDDFRAASAGMRIDESIVQSEFMALLDLTSGSLTSKQATMTSSTISFRTDNVALLFKDGGMNVSGAIAFRSNLARLMAWTYDPNDPPTQHVFGEAVGRANLSHKSGVTLAEWTADVNDFAIAQRKQPAASRGIVSAATANPWEPVWREKLLKLKGKGDYSHVSGAVHVDDVKIISDSLDVSAKGNVKELASTAGLNLEGEVGYDLATIAALLRPTLGQDFQIDGRDKRKFSMQGPLFATTTKSSGGGSTSDTASWPPNDLSAQAAIAWSSAYLQGFKFGKGELHAKLSQGVISVDPLDMAVSNGRVRLAPRVLLNENPAVLVLDRGRMLDSVQLTPEMCKAWIKYVAPLLADATKTEGILSLDMTGAKLPLSDPAKGTAQGTMHVHQAKIGPGPIGQQIEAVVRQIVAIADGRGLDAAGLSGSRGWVSMPEQSIPFQMVDGKVYHDGLKLEIGEVAVSTKGYVGTDQSLSITATVPIRDRWVSGSPIFAGLKGQTIELPISGTLTSPVVDNRVVANLTQKLLGGSVEGLLEKGLQEGLKGLFGR